METSHTICDTKWDLSELVEASAGAEGHLWLVFVLYGNLVVGATQINGAEDMILSNLIDCVFDMREQVTTM